MFCKSFVSVLLEHVNILFISQEVMIQTLLVSLLVAGFQCFQQVSVRSLKIVDFNISVELVELLEIVVGESVEREQGAVEI